MSHIREKDPRHFPDSLRRLEMKKPGKKLARKLTKLVFTVHISLFSFDTGNRIYYLVAYARANVP